MDVYIILLLLSNVSNQNIMSCECTSFYKNTNKYYLHKFNFKYIHQRLFQLQFQ